MGKSELLKKLNAAIRLLYGNDPRLTIHQLNPGANSIYISADVKNVPANVVTELKSLGFTSDHCHFRYMYAVK